jgi:hypothetical protein
MKKNTKQKETVGKGGQHIVDIKKPTGGTDKATTTVKEEEHDG